MTDSSDYVRGTTYARKERPTFEYKPSSTNYTGGGYARVRSSEYRDHTAGDGTDDVFVSVHRLAAVAWLLPDGELGTDVFLSDMGGMDVHHTQPDRDAPGMPASNGEDWLELIDHGGHSEVTQAQMRAWGEDAKKQATLEYDETDVPDDRCAECDEPDPDCRVGEKLVCLECSMKVDADGPIEVLD